ncbi:MAG: hypothetical protein QXX23_06900 [Thermoplasmata archaeon]
MRYDTSKLWKALGLAASVIAGGVAEQILSKYTANILPVTIGSTSTTALPALVGAGLIVSAPFFGKYSDYVSAAGAGMTVYIANDALQSAGMQTARQTVKPQRIVAQPARPAYQPRTQVYYPTKVVAKDYYFAQTATKENHYMA